MGLLNLRVHDLYRIADGLVPLSDDSQAVRLHCRMVEQDPACTALLRQLEDEET